jgi:RNA polymerase sigma factor (sigma-70 family)
MSGIAIANKSRIESMSVSPHLVRATQLITSSDEQLLAAIAVEGSTRRTEMEEFYRRHVRYLYAVVRKQSSSLGFAQSECEDIVHDTFQRAFDHAASFRPSESVDGDAQRCWTRAWLGRIARNLILDALGSRKEVLASDSLEREESPVPPSSGRKDPRLEALERIIEELSDREQDILRVTAMYHRAGERHQRLPNEVSQQLALRWGTTSENIRAIRMRALKKVQLAMQPLGLEVSNP